MSRKDDLEQSNKERYNHSTLSTRQAQAGVVRGEETKKGRHARYQPLPFCGCAAQHSVSCAAVMVTRLPKQAVPGSVSPGHGRCGTCNPPVYSFTITCNGARTVDAVGL